MSDSKEITSEIPLSQLEQSTEIESNLSINENPPCKSEPAPETSIVDILQLKCEPGFIDTHCHLDFLLSRKRYWGGYGDYMRCNRATYPASYEGCVTIFCHPSTFRKVRVWMNILAEDGVWGAFGCHPHFSKMYSATVQDQLYTAIKHPKVRALGEIGLDFSGRNNCSKRVQHRVFRQQLKIALRLKMPIVIHCREANEDTMGIMKEIIPSDHIIHLHCFTDTWEWAQQWLDAFPNLCIGFTNKVTYPSSTQMHEVVKNIPLDRLLLETDAPYFVPDSFPRSRKLSHPGMAIYVALKIAELRCVSVESIIHHTRQNTHKVYGI